MTLKSARNNKKSGDFNAKLAFEKNRFYPVGLTQKVLRRHLKFLLNIYYNIFHIISSARAG